ncbi:hypothetical protein ACWC24_32200 [Streptomyces sp. NPDC001443]
MSGVVIEFITLDGIVSDPDGSAGTPLGGWAFRHGPEAVAGDKFRLGSTLDDGVLLLGRGTWQLFSRLLAFPTVLGTGHRLFPAGAPHTELRCLSAEQTGAVLTRHVRPSR